MSSDEQWMARVLELAARGEGAVEPNPMVGAVVVRDGRVVGEGWHERFGGPHAEVNALAAAGDLAKGATLYVTLEPCCHQGKTPPCTEAVLRAGVARVVAAMPDPFPRVAGQGLEILRSAGLTVDVGVREDAARELTAPYRKLLGTGKPWVIAKWAMSLDGKIATRTGHSRWISGEESRARVHQLRGRVDAIIVGAGTLREDDPLLTARPPGVRTAARIVMTRSGELPTDRRLSETAGEGPVMIATGAETDSLRRWRDGGCEVLPCDGVDSLLAELGRRRMTNVLVEGGSGVLGAFCDAGEMDELFVFVAPVLLGGGGAPAPLAGVGVGEVGEGLRLAGMSIEKVGADVLIRGRLSTGESPVRGPARGFRH